MPVFKIHHITRYEYDRPVKESVNEIKIFPFVDNHQETLQHDLVITGSPEILIYTDYWGNRAGTFNLLPPHRELVIESKLLVRTTGPDERPVHKNVFYKDLTSVAGNDLQLLTLTKVSPVISTAIMEEYATALFHPEKDLATIITDCCTFIFTNFSYIKGITTIESTVDELLEKKAGVCQDFAHVMLEILRMIGIPSRYISGYICPNKNGMRVEGATHAWVEAYIPGYGWAGIDPTNNVWVTNKHIKLAIGHDFSDCTPVKGTFKGPARQSLSVYVAVSYEGGNSFEELTNVHLEKQSSLTAENFIDTFAGQQ
jgi:transglutaminase-like putative cysteine protease